MRVCVCACVREDMSGVRCKSTLPQVRILGLHETFIMCVLRTMLSGPSIESHMDKS